MTNPETNAPSKAAFVIPESVKKVLERLPTPEALQVMEDIGKVAWVVDNNNNNNSKKSILEERFLSKIPALKPEQLAEILATKE